MSVEIQENPSEQDENKKNLRERLYLPFTIPLISAGLVALLGISFSRIFLAGAHEEEGAVAVAGEASKSSNPVFWATIVTVVVLVGAALISLAKSMRPMSFKLILAGTVLAVLISGAIIYGSGEESTAGPAAGQPTAEEIASADPANAIEVDALGSNLFSTNAYTVKAGVVHIKYIGKGGSHQLKFKGKFDWFDLAVNAGTEAEGDVNLVPGEYVIYCPIPGHEAMTATLDAK
ncbi:MAG: hypothetical protein KBF89_06940 [Acidimicrobiia bacterium]|nr:hypothetical protein [Acidimicrobiia bacterium]